MDIFQLNQYSGASFIQILMIWMFHLLKTFEWDSIIKCYIKIHYLNALGTKLFLIAMPHCTYFVHNFKTFRRHFSHVRLFFLLDDWKSWIIFGSMSTNVCILIILIFTKCNLNKTVEDYIFLLLYIFFISDDHFILVQNVKCWFFFHMNTGRCFLCC